MQSRLAVVLAALLLSAGCARYLPAPPPPEPGAMAARQGAGANASAPLPSAERMLIRRAELELEVSEPGSLAPRIEEITRAAGGYVEGSVASEGRLRTSVRVPSDQLDAVLASLSALGEVERRQVSAQDVTEQVFDLEARLQNLRAVRDRLRQYLERTAQVSEIIEVERELTRVQSDIDMLEGRLNRLRTETSMSQITLEVRQKRILGPLGQLLHGLAWIISKLFVIR